MEVYRELTCSNLLEHWDEVVLEEAARDGTKQNRPSVVERANKEEKAIPGMV